MSGIGSRWEGPPKRSPLIPPRNCTQRPYSGHGHHQRGRDVDALLEGFGRVPVGVEVDRDHRNGLDGVHVVAHHQLADPGDRGPMHGAEVVADSVFADAVKGGRSLERCVARRTFEDAERSAVEQIRHGQRRGWTTVRRWLIPSAAPLARTGTDRTCRSRLEQSGVYPSLRGGVAGRVRMPCSPPRRSATMRRGWAYRRVVLRLASGAWASPETD